jgi:serine/threonine-protein kinase
VKVLDFGIAKLTERDPVSTEQGQTLGTPRYMSPEQIRIDAGDEVGPASDQFSLGTIAYELVAGRPAFPGSAHAAMLAVLNNQPEPLPAYVPAGYREAVARAMSSRPQDRFPGVAEFIQALEEGVFAEPPPPAPVPLRALWLGGLGLCGVLLLLIIWAQGSRETPPRPPAPAPDLVRAAAPVPPAPVAVPLPADDAAEPDPAAGGPRVRTVEVRGLPEGAQLFLNGKLVHGRTLRLPVGVPVRLRAVPRRGSCYEGRELVYTPPPDRLPPPLVMELPRDKDCPFY